MDTMNDVRSLNNLFASYVSMWRIFERSSEELKM